MLMQVLNDGKASHDVAITCRQCRRLIPVIGNIGQTGSLETHRLACPFCGTWFFVEIEIIRIADDRLIPAPPSGAGILDENGRQIDPPWEEPSDPLTAGLIRAGERIVDAQIEAARAMKEGDDAPAKG